MGIGVTEREGFPNPTIFVACPGDMGIFAASAADVIDKLSRSWFLERLQAYYWQFDKRQKGWGAETSWQEEIVGPQRPNCISTIVLLGERIGKLLPEGEFSREAMNLLRPVAARYNLRLVHRRAKRHDELPLTGTTFEVFSSLLWKRHTPVFVYGDKTALRYGQPAQQRNLGFGTLKRLLDGSRAQREEYEYQVTMVARLVDGLSGEPGVHHFVNDQHLRAEIQDVFCTHFDIVRSRSRTEIFRGLLDYDVDDHDIFFGRGQASKYLIEQLEAAEAAGHSPVIVLRGPSGDGKSSLAKAGVAGGLMNLSKLKTSVRHIGHAIDSSEVNLCSDGEAAIKYLAASILARIATVNHQPADWAETPKLEPEFVARICAALDRTEAGTRLVLVVDQFEVALSLEESAFKLKWAPLLAALRALADTHRCWLIITHPSGPDIRRWDDLRNELTDFKDIRSPFAEKSRGVIVLSTDKNRNLSFIAEAAVGGMFAAARIEVGSLVEAICEEFARSGCLLPFLSSYCEAVASRAELVTEDASSAGTDAIRTDATTATYVLKPSSVDELSFADVIESLGERAVTEFGKDVGEEIGVGGVDRSSVSDQLRQLLNHLAFRQADFVPGEGLIGKRWVLEPVHRGALEVSPALLQRLEEHRLIKAPSASTIKLTHEVILTDWKRAREWAIEQERHLACRALLAPHVESYKKDKAFRFAERDLQDAAELLLGSGLAVVMSDAEHDLVIDTLVGVLERRAEDGLGPVLLAAMRSRNESLVTQYLEKLRSLGSTHLIGRREIRLHLDARFGPRNCPITHYAALSGRDELVRDLLALGALPHMSGDDGQTLVHVAAQYCRTETVDALLTVQAELLASQDSTLATPLHAAAKGGKTATVEYLLKCGADPWARDRNGSTPLHLAAAHAAFNGSSTTGVLVGALLNAAHTRNPTEGNIALLLNRARWAPIAYAARSGDASSVAAMAQSLGAMPLPKLDNGKTPLHLAAKYGHQEAIDALIQHVGPSSFEINVGDGDGLTPLHHAVIAGSLGVIESLLAAGAGIDVANNENFTPTGLAFARQQRAIADRLLEHACEIGAFDAVSDALRRCQWSSELTGALLQKLGTLNGPSFVRDVVNRRAVGGLPPLLAAAAGGVLDIAQLLVEHGAELELTDNFGLTALHLSGRRGKQDVIDFLAASGANLHACNRELRTPLHEAARSGTAAAVLRILELAPQSSSMRDERGNTPLHALTSRDGSSLAVEEFTTCWRAFLRAGASPTTVGWKGQTPFVLAIISGNPVLKELLDASPQVLEIPRRDGAYPIHVAASVGNLSAISLIVARSPLALGKKSEDRGPWRGSEPIHWAVRSESCGAAEQLLAMGADVNARDGHQFTPLIRAGQLGRISLVEFLLDHGADPHAANSRGRTALHEAGSLGHEKIWDILLRSAPDLADKIDSKGRKPQFQRYVYAPEATQQLRDFLESGGDPNCKSAGGIDRQDEPGLLHLVSGMGTREEVKLLLQFGADADLIDNFGNLPIVYAIQKRNRENVETLLDVTPQESLRERNELGESLLHHASDHFFSDGIDLLLAHGFDPFSPDSEGRIPLHRAAKVGAYECLEALLRVTDASKVDWPDTSNGKSALRKAVDGGLSSPGSLTPASERVGENRLKCVIALIAAGADTDHQAHDRQTPLDIARTLVSENGRKICAALEAAKRSRRSTAGLASAGWFRALLRFLGLGAKR